MTERCKGFLGHLPQAIIMAHYLEVVPILRTPHVNSADTRSLAIAKPVFEPPRIQRFSQLLRWGIPNFAIRRPGLGLELVYNHIFPRQYFTCTCQKAVKPGREWVLDIAFGNSFVLHPFVDRYTKLIRCRLTYRQSKRVIATGDNQCVFAVQAFY